MAAVGLAVGFGMYVLSLTAVILILAALWVLDYVEDALPKTRYRTVLIRTKYRVGCVAEAVARFKQAGMHVVDASFERTEDLSGADIQLRVAFLNSAQYYNIERQIEGDAHYQLLATREL